MKLYYAPSACSMAPHITLREAGLAFDSDRVDLAKKQTSGGEDYLQVNPKGYVPALRLDDGGVLTEVAVLLQYIADRTPESGLAPRAGTMERYRLMEWLNFIATEVHKSFGPLWNPATPDATKEAARALIAKRLAIVEAALVGRPYLTGETFSIADAYLFTIVNWTNVHKIDLAPWSKLKEFMARVAARPKVQETMRAEGLIK